MKKWANQYRRSRNSYPRSGGLLSNEQKASICIVAREAFDKLFGGIEQLKSTKDLREWRCREQFLAVGKESLRDCVQSDYRKLLGHFQNLAGHSGRAVKSYMLDEVQDEKIAMRKLEKECELRGLDLSYPGKICRNKFKCDLDEATPRQLWCLVFDIRTSGKKLIAESTPAAPAFVESNNQPF